MTKKQKTEATDEQLAALAERLQDPEHAIVSGGVASDPVAADGRALLEREYGSTAELDQMLRQAGRPKVGQTARGSSPTVRGRISEADYAAFKRLAEATGRSQSELVREAVHDMLTRHQTAS
ncbi:CopG family transcriptional regulator [Calidifontibacter sp. DB0510]|uniref:CopG family transcriptional regulator n=1 Tax=Metallococcus carri TaxID=1656884 RepID=A0A967AZI7_9MICO|nr:ribbon-helix-helix protein, CopG family [Metallococcus carri]NHN54695.1 CopG family transcriptional regulator [Metallococcus carri]NOP37040.1 CopG family transcriptional regulator [Calidifontibacter sp. DB2511S]